MQKMDQQKKDTVFVSFATQKGGAGKTTTTMNVASLVNAESDLKIAVVDLDHQFSFSNTRNREWEDLTGEAPDSTLAKAYLKLREAGKDRYPVFQLDLFPLVTANDPEFLAWFNVGFREGLAGLVERGIISGEIRKVVERSDVSKSLVADLVYKPYLLSVTLDKIKGLKERGEYDVVFFDFPGTTGFEEIATVIKYMDYILVPLYPDSNTVDSALAFLEAIDMSKANGSGIKDFTVFRWKYSKDKNRGEFEVLASAIVESGYKLMENKIFESTEIERGRSTIAPFDLKGLKSMRPFVDEVLKFINK